MKYILYSDILSNINEDILCDLLDSQDSVINTGITYPILDAVEAAALDQCRTYLNGFYDFEYMINTGNTDVWDSNFFRNIVLDIMIYELECRVSPSAGIPQLRIDRYNGTIQTLRDIAKRVISPKWPSKNNVYQTSTTILIGSQPKNNHIY